ncbi:LysR family transcriptional regulator [Bdellovibrio sp. KM01]|uniref:LysR family transcriptional regulator n=1 Tax=Bdellovibrio sp. KM01 TaxID=2748865 RepID=UPI0015E9DDF7|nr:LysR family transcriptional regulator [Bdellovibrio sp. KM01]QLY24690.1 LysR family transcriptional regulator [Bdellovibrio sp. KM01]
MNWLNYHHLYYFWTVAKKQSFTKAAEELRVAQSAVSLQLAQLEDFLGKKLIIRSTSKKLVLTEEGQIVFRQAEEIFRQGKELVDGLKEGGLNSSIRFGALGSLSKNLQIRLLRPVLESNDFQLSVDVGDASTLLTRLKGFHLDAILCDVPYPHSEDEPLIQRQIAKEHFCFIAREKRAAHSLSESLETKGIYLPAKSNPATSEIEGFLNSLKSKVKIKGYIDDIALLRLLALETEALVAIPKIGAERELKEKRLIVVHEFRSLFQKFYLVLRQNGQRSEKILKLLKQI